MKFRISFEKGQILIEYGDKSCRKVTYDVAVLLKVFHTWTSSLLNSILYIQEKFFWKFTTTTLNSQPGRPHVNEPPPPSFFGSPRPVAARDFRSPNRWPLPQCPFGGPEYESFGVFASDPVDTDEFFRERGEVSFIGMEFVAMEFRIGESLLKLS